MLQPRSESPVLRLEFEEEFSFALIRKAEQRSEG